MSQLKFRPATSDDCLHIARFYQSSSDGVADYIWSKLAAEGESPLQVGERRYQREGTDFSYRNCTLVESGGNPVGMLFAFPMNIDPDYVEDDPVLKPYSELEQAHSYYISGVAVDESFRGQGIGKLLMELAERKCREKGLDELSLIVFEQNTGAKRLYDRLGYREIERRRITPHPLIHYTSDAILMSRELEPTS